MATASFTNLDALLKEDEEEKKRREAAGGSASQSGGQAYSASKPSGGSNLDALASRPKPAPQQVSQTQQAPAESTGVWSSITGGVKKAASKVLDLGERGLKAGLDLWNSQNQKNELASFEMRELMYGRKSLVQDPVTGKKTLTTDALTAFRSAQTPEEKNAILERQQQNIPIVRAMNSPTGRAVLGYIGEKTSNIPLKAIATLRSIGDETYDEAYAALQADRNNPENGAFKSFLYELQDSGVQSALGVVLSLGTTYVSRSPMAGRTVGSSYFAGISAAGQQEERGEVNSLGNIGIDVIGDQILSTSLETVFKGGGSVIRAALKSAGIEGTTEVTQSFLKYGNDYGNARTEAEKAQVLADAKNYVVNGGILMEFAVGATAGGVIGATAEYVAPTMTLDVKETGGEGDREPEQDGAPAKVPAKQASTEDEGYYSNARDILAEYEAALNAGETVANDEEFANVGELRNQLDDYQTLNKDKTFFLPERASVEVVEYDDGNFAYRFSATAGNMSVSSPFLNTDLHKSKEAATEAGLKEILTWIRTQRDKASTPEERAVLSKLQDDMIEQSQKGEEDYSDIIAEAAGGRGRYPTIHEGGIVKMVEGDPVSIVDGVETFIHKGDGGWVVSEASTGRFIADSRTKEGAIAKAKFTIDDVGVEKFLETIAKNQLPEGALESAESEGETEGEGETQVEKVKKAVKGTKKSIKEVAEETGILEPNVRRILGVGTKEGVFERVDKGVYTLTIGDKDIAFVETGNAVESLPRLAAEGFKADMIFLDIPYDTAAVKGGNRGVKYDLLSVADFKKVVSAVSTIARTDDTPVLHMFSQAASGMKDMQKYNDVLLDAGFKPIARGEWQKLFKDGRPVTNVRGQVAKPEGILLLSKSGQVSSLPEEVSLDFSFVRPKGYSTEKPAEMLKALIELTTEEDAMVLDPFAGSGVTAAEAVRAGRKAYAIEKNEEVAEKITKPRVKKAVEERAAERKPFFFSESGLWEQMEGQEFEMPVAQDFEELVNTEGYSSKELSEAWLTRIAYQGRVPSITKEGNLVLFRGSNEPEMPPLSYMIATREDAEQYGAVERYEVDPRDVSYSQEEDAWIYNPRNESTLMPSNEEAPAKKPVKKALKGREVITIEVENLDDAEVELLRGGTRGVGNLKSRVITLDGEKFDVPDQLVTKTQLKQLLGDEDSVDFSIVEKEGELFMTYETDGGKVALRPRALGLFENRLKDGQVMRVTKEALKKKGTSLRAYDAGGNAVGFIPRDELRDEVFGAIQEKLDSTKLVSSRAQAPETPARDPSTANALGFIPKNLANVDSKAGRKELDKVVKRSEIAADLSEKLGVPIRRGKFRGKALGIYKPDQQLIRYKKGGLPTIFHEAGHFIDYTVFPFGNEIYKDKKELEALIEEYGAPLNTPKRQKEEAFAEFMRFYMTQPEKAKSKAPKFLAFFETQLQQLPEIKEVIDRAKADFVRWNEMPATQKVLSQVSLTGDQESIRERFSSTIGNLYRQGVDDLNPIFEYSKVAAERLGKEIPAEENPYVLARNLRGWIGKANTFLETGTFGKKFWKEDERGKIVPEFKGKGLRQILKPIEDAGAVEDFTVYLISKRTVELAGRSIESGVTAADAQAAIDELIVKHPTFEQAAKDLYKYQDDLLVYGHESGLYDKKMLEKIRELNQSYVPFFRVMEELEERGYMGKGIGNVRNGIKKIKGSDREIINPLESIVKNTYAVINAAERNNVALAMASLSSKDSVLGQLMEPIATPMSKSASVDIGAELETLFGKNNPVLADVPPEVMDSIVNVFRPSMITKDNTITVLEDGKRKFFEVDKDLYTAMQGLEVEQMGMILQVLSYPAKWLRAGATLTPEFVLRNPIRDQFSAFAYSRNNYLPFIDLMRGIFSLVRKDTDYWLWRMGGGEHSMLVSLDRAELKQRYDDVVSTRDLTTKKGIKTVLLDLRNPLRVTQLLSELTEKGTRLGEAKAALRRANNPIESAFAAREVTLDFARIGEKTRAFNAITAFFNVWVQDVDKMFRSFKTAPARTASKVFLGITLPSIILYFLNRDEEGWEEIPQWQKDLCWLIKVGDTWYRIPKPFNLGILFGSAPERALEYLDRRDPQLLKDLQHSIFEGFTPSVMPTAILPLIENVTNYNFFYGRAIVPRNKVELPAEAQYGNYTSETAKKLGEIIKYPPAKIDNLINGYFAGIGNYAVDIMDSILEGTGIASTVVAPAKELAEQPVLKAFIVRDPEGSGSVSVERFYLEWEKANQASQYIKKLQNDGDDEGAYKFLAEHPEAELAKYYNQVQSEISEMNKSRNEIYESDFLSAEEKRQLLDEIDKAMTVVAHNAIEMSLNYGNE